MRTAALLAAALLAGGCASMDKPQCVNANWYAIGMEDGAQGRTLQRLGDHRRACAEHGVQPDAERYAAGRNEGRSLWSSMMDIAPTTRCSMHWNTPRWTASIYLFGCSSRPLLPSMTIDERGVGARDIMIAWCSNRSPTKPLKSWPQSSFSQQNIRQLPYSSGLRRGPGAIHSA